MKAENQTMLIEEAAGQQAVQALFMQTRSPVKMILNCEFEQNPQDGNWYYVYSGTADNYMQFRSLMADYAVYPAHEIEGHPSNPKTAKAAEGGEEEAPVVNTAPAVADIPDTLSGDAPELSATEGEVVEAPKEKADEPAVRTSEQPANGGQPSAGEGGQAGGASAGGGDVHGGGHGGGAAAGGGSGGEASGGDGGSAVNRQGVTETPAADEDDDDPFKGL